MTFHSNVQPPRKPKPTPLQWWCNCETADGMKLQPAHVVECPDCGAKRRQP